MGRLFDYTVFPLLLPFILLWLAAARVLSMAVPVLLYPLHLVLNRRLREALPFLPHLWRHEGWLLGGLLRLGFEASHTMNVARRFLTLPLRRRTPDFLVVGFPQSGSCSMSAYLKLHPCISGIDGLNYNEVRAVLWCGNGDEWVDGTSGDLPAGDPRPTQPSHPAATRTTSRPSATRVASSAGRWVGAGAPPPAPHTAPSSPPASRAGGWRRLSAPAR